MKYIFGCVSVYGERAGETTNLAHSNSVFDLVRKAKDDIESLKAGGWQKFVIQEKDSGKIIWTWSNFTVSLNEFEEAENLKLDSLR